MPTRPGLLECIERYFAAAPLPDARIERAGALAVPVGDPAWPYPRGPARARTGDRRRRPRRRRAAGGAGLPAALEWLPERSPETAGAARAAGLAVEELPLLVADDPVELLPPHGVTPLRGRRGRPAVARYQWVAETAFAHPGGPADVRRGRPRTPGPMRAPARPRSGSASPPAGP